MFSILQVAAKFCDNLYFLQQGISVVKEQFSIGEFKVVRLYPVALFVE